MTELTIAAARKAGYDIVERSAKGRAGKGMVWLRLSDGTAKEAKARVPEAAADKLGYKPNAPKPTSSPSMNNRLTVQAVAEFIDKSDEDRLAKIFKEVGFTQRDKIAEMLPLISKLIKQDEIAKIEAEIKALEARKKALSSK